MTRNAATHDGPGWVVAAAASGGTGLDAPAGAERAGDAELDRLAELAADVVNVPMARIVVVVDCMAAPVEGLPATALEREFGPFMLDVDAGDTLAFADAPTEGRLDGLAKAAQDTGLRFLAGAPVFIEGVAVGALVVGSPEPRQIGASGRQRLSRIASLASSILTLRSEALAHKGAAESARLLQRELNHRVRNTLAVLQSIVGQTLKTRPEPDEFMEAFTGRLHAMADAHSLLAEQEWRSVGLSALVRRLVAPFVPDETAQLTLKGKDVELPPDQTIGLAFALHELATNACTHGSLSVPEGQVAINWTLSRSGGRRTLSLEWKERCGPRVSEPRRSSFGLLMIRHSLDKILSSRVDLRFAPEGLVAKIRLPLG